MIKPDEKFAIPRKRMINEQLISRGISDEKILNIMSQINRHDFVEEALKNQAYIDAPLAIGEGQTISQPYIVALMTEALQLRGSEKVLEIGTGCGYQTVVLSLACHKVYTIERVKSLALEARQRFKQYALRNIVMRVGDGTYGWPDSAPFDRIIVTCASPQIPEILVSQLSEGGMMVVPCTSGNGDHQQLIRVTRRGESYSKEDLGDCRFVKMIGKYGYSS
jgi:protein-L-isoaspartate(D-aspartate) O-methyltransferase